MTATLTIGSLFAGYGEQHVDHITAYATGGKETEQNLRITHDLCNIRKETDNG